MDENDVQEIQKSWNQVENNIKTIALGDGISSGCDKKYQEYFNKGFSYGFNSAIIIGQQQGSLFGESIQKNSQNKENELISKPKMAWCQICEKPELSNESLSEVKKQQKEVNHRNIEQLLSR